MTTDNSNPLLQGLSKLPEGEDPIRKPGSGNPLLEKVKLPGKVFRLPSRGLMYHNGEVVCEDGEIHVKALSALTEVNLKNADMLLTGKAFHEVIRECVPEVKKPELLYGKDVDAILLYLRLVTYGSNFDIVYDHGCKDSKSHDYTVDLNPAVSTMRYVDEEYINEKYTVTTDAGQVVRLRPYRLKDLLHILSDTKNENEYSVEEYQERIVSNLKNMIMSVDGIEDASLIEEWLRMLTSNTIRKIVSKMEDAEDWGPHFTTTIQCKDCGEEVEIEMPINPINFFSA